MHLSPGSRNDLKKLASETACKKTRRADQAPRHRHTLDLQQSSESPLRAKARNNDLSMKDFIRIENIKIKYRLDSTLNNSILIVEAV
jgi:hypothetical protein